MSLLLEAPWWVPAVGLLVAAAVWFHGNRRLDRGLQRLGLVLAAVAAAVGAVSIGVQTPREAVETRSRRLVSSASSGDWASFADLLHPEVTFRGFDAYSDAPTFAAGARASVERIGLSWARSVSVSVQPEANQFVAVMDCLSQQQITMDRPIVTSWRLTWSRSDGQWRLIEIESLPRPQLSPEQVIGQLAVPAR